jgi:hypothetical protein
VKKNFSACKQFFNLEIDARIIAAALNLLGLRSLEGIPDESALHNNPLKVKVKVYGQMTSVLFRP